tara:strand:- start:1293 stop:2393 length:1101 start_codon:yes stop_codon:yes gene_type:complete
MNSNSKRVIIAGGGTGGHLFPAIAIGEKLREDGFIVKHIGSSNGIEANEKFINQDQIELLDLNGFSRGYSIISIIKNIKLLFKILRSYIEVKSILKRFNPDFVIGTGGYSCAIPLYVAWKRNIHTAIQEQNVLPGIVTKKFANKVKVVFTAFSETNEFLSKSNCCLVGNPIRAQIENSNPTISKGKFNLDINKFTILIIGGSQGARSINMHFMNNYKKYTDRDIQFIWQTGNQSDDIVSKINNNNIKIIDFIDDIENAYAASDLVVSRAGATAISEILYLAKPSILIPYPFAAENHQEYNANALIRKNAAIMVKEESFKDGVLEREIFELIDCKDKIENIKKNALSVSHKNSAILIKNKIREIISC